MREMRQGWSFQALDWGLGAVFALVLAVGALAGGLKLPGAWAIPVLISLGIVATGKAQVTPLYRPVLLAAVAVPYSLIEHGAIDFLWILLGSLFSATVLSGERMGPWLTKWLGRLVVAGVGTRLLLGWLTPLPPPEGQTFLLALAICLLSGPFIAHGIFRIGLLPFFLVAGVALFDRLDWILVGCGVASSSAVGRRPWRGLILLAICAIFAWRAQAHDFLVITLATDGLLRKSPALLIACFWFGSETLALLRRSWKEEPKEIVLSGAGAVGLLASALWVTDRAADPANLFLAIFCISLGLAARRKESDPSWEVVSISGAPARKAVMVAAVALGGAAVGAISVLSETPPNVSIAALLLLLQLGFSYFYRDGWPGILLGPTVFAGLAFLVTRAFGMDLAPGSALWWKSTQAPTALFALAAALAGAGHAIRRPGRIGAAQVAGAVACLWLLGLVALDDLVVAVRGREIPLNVSFGAFSAFMLFIGWAGPLELGHAKVEGAAKRLVGLPIAATAFALAAIVIAGLT